MAENVRAGETSVPPHTSTMQYNVNANDTRQRLDFIMMRDESVRRGLTLASRTVERSRIFADNISSTIEEIRPLIEHARVRPNISLSSLLNIQRLQDQVRTTPSPSDSYIITVEEQTPDSVQVHDAPVHDHQRHHHTTTTDNFLNNIREAANEVAAENQNVNNNNNNNNNAEEPSMDTLQISPETRVLLNALQKYVPFILILLVKGIYDHRAGILNFIVLLVTFIHANNDLKREIAKQQNRSWTSLLVIMCYITACIVFINFMFDVKLNVFNPSVFSSQSLTVWEVLWSVTVTDFVLKLITIVFKIILTCLPVRLLAFQKRGKYYLMVEATSQLYRCMAPIHLWFNYFLDAYQGPEQILGAFLSVAYAIRKGSDIISRGKLFRKAIWKILQNVSLGVSPSKEQLVASGGICAICHEEYSMPVRLHCKHIFCETCVSTWLDRERSCPLCRAPITDNPIYRDGHTTHFIQLY